MSNSFPMGNEFPQVATRIAYGETWQPVQIPFPICIPKTRVSPCLPRIMHIMHGLNLHMHAEEGERTITFTMMPHGDVARKKHNKILSSVNSPPSPSTGFGPAGLPPAKCRGAT